MSNKKSSKRMAMLVSGGSSFTNWIKILYLNKFKVDLAYIPRAILVTFTTLLFMPFIFIERLIFDRKINKAEVKAPLFIIGHMRSGTTFIHQLFSTDKRYTYATTSDSTFPWVFLTLNKFVRFICSAAMPEKRPMDNMKIGPDLPQEEEFAIANICPYSPNNGAYFIRHIEDWYKQYSFFDGVDDRIKNRWKKWYSYYLKKLVLKSGGKQILSKSIVNSGRINMLKEMFPDAKFVFIYRNPYKVFLSTKKLYKTFILKDMNFQNISDEKLEQMILNLAKEGLEKYMKDRVKFDDKSLAEVQFEKIIVNPVSEMERIYKQLKLGNFEDVRKDIEIIAEGYKDYKEDTYGEDPVIKDRVKKYFNIIYETYGYK